MSDPLGVGTFDGAGTDLMGLITTSYVPSYVTLIVFASGVGLGLTYLARGLRALRRK